MAMEGISTGIDTCYGRAQAHPPPSIGTRGLWPRSVRHPVTFRTAALLPISVRSPVFTYAIPPLLACRASC